MTLLAAQRERKGCEETTAETNTNVWKPNHDQMKEKWHGRSNNSVTMCCGKQ